MHDMAGLAYINTGDWVESCTAVVEHQDGRMELIHWAAQSRALNVQRSLPAPWRRHAA
jgi:hypothetical protein